MEDARVMRISEEDDGLILFDIERGGNMAPKMFVTTVLKRLGGAS